MKRRMILKLWNTLGKLEGQRHDIRFSYFLAKNKVAIKPEIEALEAINKPSPDFIEYETKRVEMAQKFADKDNSGKPKIFDNQYVILEKRDEFETEIKKLKTKYKKAIESREKQIEEYDKFLDEDVDFNPSKIRFSQMPQQIESGLLEIFVEANIIEDDTQQAV